MGLKAAHGALYVRSRTLLGVAKNIGCQTADVRLIFESLTISRSQATQFHGVALGAKRISSKEFINPGCILYPLSCPHAIIYRRF